MVVNRLNVFLGCSWLTSSSLMLTFIFISLTKRSLPTLMATSFIHCPNIKVATPPIKEIEAGPIKEGPSIVIKIGSKL